MGDELQQQILAQFLRSKIWDERTQRAVDMMRLCVHRRPQPTITDIQQNSRQGRPVKLGFRTEQDTILPPVEDDIGKHLFRTIKEMGDISYKKPKLAPVPVEWTTRESSANKGNKLVSFMYMGTLFLREPTGLSTHYNATCGLDWWPSKLHRLPFGATKPISS
ncbi:hypothetical protein G7Y89_g14166 [Cudoniella acicularis]|uniref:Uncharacterized protein n=1 Tax=Cudoniella acicularis TaxID=354080 RepID=A0A8H4R6V3_9HELO|nr:hypothetical protein G7Y89_g14166 [Cudoniella acicularis]